MKKLLSLVLVLVMALSIATTALAFTEVEYDDDDNPVTLAIKLIDVGDGIVNVNFTAPPSNRGYVKNEVVCAIVSMYVPKGVKITDDYNKLVFSGDNVTLWQDENFYADRSNKGMLNHMSSNAKAAFRDVTGGPLTTPFAYGDMTIDNEIVVDNEDDGLTALEEAADKKAQTFHFAIFGKVVGDDAWMKATLKGVGALKNAKGDGVKPTEGSEFNFVGIKGDDYTVGYFNPNVNGTDDAADAKVETVAKKDDFTTIQLGAKDVLYYVNIENPAAALSAATAGFAIVTDKNYNCVGMYVECDGTWYQVKVVGSKYTNAQYISGWGVYVQIEELDDPQEVADAPTSALIARYIVTEEIWDVFGLNLNKKGQMKPEWWAGNKEKSAEVQVEPWYNEVTVPAEIELEAPKTGDAVTALGFVLVALAGLAFVAVRKVNA